MGFGGGSFMSWTICKQSAPRYRQITTPAHNHSILMADALTDAQPTVSKHWTQVRNDRVHAKVGGTSLAASYAYSKSPVAAWATMSAWHCANTSVSSEANFAPDLKPRVSQDPAKTGHHECSSSKLCVAALVVASSSLEEIWRWLG